MKTITTSKFVSANTFNKMNEVERKKLIENLDNKIKQEIEGLDDPVAKRVQRKFTTSVMIKIQREARPIVKDEKGLDILKVKFGV